MKIEVSLGELVDKVSILAIKLEKIQAGEKLANIRKEYGLLYRKMREAGISEDSSEYRDLYAINLKLWEIEDRIRAREAAKTFDDEFIELARSVYKENDQRAAVKREINLKYGSAIIEEKSYAAYN
ncbi:MAG: DUF6165 family protein [Desulfosalsimonadaceae bacterium]